MLLPLQASLSGLIPIRLLLHAFTTPYPPPTGAACTATHSDRSALLRLQASLSEMIPPGALVMLTPVIVGVLFGTRTLAGVLAGALVSGVQMAVSMSNTGGGRCHSH